MIVLIALALWTVGFTAISQLDSGLLIAAPVLLLLGLNGVFLVAGGTCTLLFWLFFIAMRK